jgi:hypothetical protein
VSEAAAARTLAEAIARVSSQRGREMRAQHRVLLARAIAEASHALLAGDEATRARAAVTLAEAHAYSAEDALHGANQLSMSAQRAPSSEACDEGWTRVAGLVETACHQARAARDVAMRLDVRAGKAFRRVEQASIRAEKAANAAWFLVSARNDAFVFHSAPGFSFGEGWHVAAAALLADITVQLDPKEPGAMEAERFLRDAGILSRVQPARPRPRAAKQLTELVARAFRADSHAALATVRRGFLGDEETSEAVRRFADARLDGVPGSKVLVWIRRGTHQPARNSNPDEVALLAEWIAAEGGTAVLVGDEAFLPLPQGAIDLSLFWKDPIFCGEGRRRAQLQLFEHLRVAHGVRGQVGVTTAGMDGPALLGLPTAYLTDVPNPRMRAWVGALPDYREIVRESGYFENILAALRAWLGPQPTHFP